MSPLQNSSVHYCLLITAAIPRHQTAVASRSYNYWLWVNPRPRKTSIYRLESLKMSRFVICATFGSSSLPGLWLSPMELVGISKRTKEEIPRSIAKVRTEKPRKFSDKLRSGVLDEACHIAGNINKITISLYSSCDLSLCQKSQKVLRAIISNPSDLYDGLAGYRIR